MQSKEWQFTFPESVIVSSYAAATHLLDSTCFFQFFLLKLVYFWTESSKNIFGCFFHSICATDFGTKNIERKINCQL